MTQPQPKECRVALDKLATDGEHSSVLQGSWSNASKKQREKLLELIRRLAEDDKEGVMAHKVGLALCLHVGSGAGFLMTCYHL